MPKCVDCKHEGKYFNLKEHYPIDSMMGMNLGMQSQVNVTLIGFEEEARKHGFTKEDLTIKGMQCPYTKDPIVLIQAIQDQPCSYFSPKGRSSEKKETTFITERDRALITGSVKIDRPVDKLWDYFTTPSNWNKWYGGGLKEVVPGWQKGAKLVWSLGGDSLIEKIIPGQEICISGAWMDTTYSFKPEGSTGTIVEVVQSDPKGGASFSDGGAANKANWEKKLRKLKECIERETYTEKSRETLPKKKETAFMTEREQALNRAKVWWEGKQDPEFASRGTYVCDSCGGPILDKRGTSLVGTWMRCASCTDRLFAAQKTPNTISSSTRTKQEKKQVCDKCGKYHLITDSTCPHCGKTKCRRILGSLIFGIVLLSIEILCLIPALIDFFKDGDVVSIFFLGFLTILVGVSGIGFFIGSISNIIQAVKIRKKIKSAPPSLNK